MHHRIKIALIATTGAAVLAACGHMGTEKNSAMSSLPPPSSMTVPSQTNMAKPSATSKPTARSDMAFFITSANPGQGANLGGLAGADAWCQKVADSVGAGGKTWRAYLSAVATADSRAVNARDRIGKGPWKNARGEVIAQSVEDLHGANNNLNKQTALTEKGEVLPGRGDAVNMHDILTGSNADGTAAVLPNGADSTCGNWTQGGAEGAAIVGHHDRVGLNDSAPMKSWNSSHPSRGCSLDALKTSGGNGRLYCFAVN